VVREPYAPAERGYAVVKRVLAVGETVELESKMDDATVFFDGAYRHVPVRLGDHVTFAASDEPLVVLGLSTRRG
jgi:NAD+ kinase